jgi:acyl carrier protein
MNMTIEEVIKEQVHGRLKDMGLDNSIIDGSMDLLQSGIYDSMSFIDMLTSVEEKVDIRLDLESSMANPATFTMDGLAKLFKNGNDE